MKTEGNPNCRIPFSLKKCFYYSLGFNYYFRAVKTKKCVRRFVPAFIDNMAAHDKGVDSTSTSCLGQVRPPGTIKLESPIAITSRSPTLLLFYNPVYFLTLWKLTRLLIAWFKSSFQYWLVKRICKLPGEICPI